MTQIHTGDAIQWAQEYEGERFHALLCDPPYHLTSITKRFGGENAAPAKEGVYARASKGFMGKSWDGGDIAFRPETWAAFLPLLHPGAFGMAFAGSRGWHRMAVAIEDAGFLIHPTIFCWASSQGFPKATRIDTQIDRAAGAEQSVTQEYERRGRSGGILGKEVTITRKVTIPATDLAKAWAGHRYGGQVLSPAVEPIIVFQKPYQGRPVACITQTGAGALNIDGSRIGDRSDKPQVQGQYATSSIDLAPARSGGKVYTEGRWASNLVMDTDCAARLDAADEFFFTFDFKPEDHDPVIYCPKVGRAERDAGLEGMAVQVKPAWEGDTRPNRDDGTTGIGNSGVQAAYHCPHPTLKPLRLLRHLATLLLPPAAYAPRRLFVPFAGAGSEVCAAHLAGWEDVQGVEMEAEYAEIARARLKFWSGNSGLFEELTQEEEDPEQFSLDF